jgi:DNA-binding NarL/FixJ family response regulator
MSFLDSSLRQVPHWSIARAAKASWLGYTDECSSLSPWDSEITRWVRIGKANNDTGTIFTIFAFTVKDHFQRIFNKHDTSSWAGTID